VLEPLGRVLARDAALRVPDAIDTSPISPRDWEAAVGSRIAARAKPVRLDRRVLVVRAATSTWAQELALLSEAILLQLRGRGVVVDSLRFRVGPVEGPMRPPTRNEVRVAPPEVPLPPALDEVVQRVVDPDLRDAIAHAAAKNLGWQLTRDGGTPRPSAGITSARSAAPAPRSAEPGSDPPDRSRPRPPAGRRGRT
jgi:hypothetical protein